MRSSHITSFLFSSVQDILDGVNTVLGPLIDLANSAISQLLSFLPSFDLPGKVVKGTLNNNIHSA